MTVLSRSSSSATSTTTKSDKGDEPGQKAPVSSSSTQGNEEKEVIPNEEQQEAIDLNQHYKEKLKWTLGDVVKHLPKPKTISSIDVKFIKAVKKFQKQNGLSVDGVVGPKTYEKVVEKKRTPFDRAVLDIAEPTIMKESSGNYGALNKNGEFRGLFGEDHRAYQTTMIGLSFGAYQFTQDSGSLGSVLKRFCKRDKHKFVSIVGPTWSRLLEVTNRSGESGFSQGILRGPRVQPIPVDYQGKRVERDLWEEPWTDIMRRLGEVPEFQIEQHQEAVERYMEPMMPFLEDHGFYSEKMVAAAFSCSIHRGSGYVTDKNGEGGAKGFIHRRILEVGTNPEIVLRRMSDIDDRYDFFLETDDLNWDDWSGWEFWQGQEEGFDGT